MKTTATLRLSAAAAIVALAGTAHADRYAPVPQDTMSPLSGDATTGYSPAEQNALAAQVAGLAGYFEETVSATVWYNTGANTITADNIRVTVPILMWENDSFFDSPVVEVLTDGTIAGAFSTASGLDNAADAELFQLNTRRSQIMSFSNVTGAFANNVFHDEAFDGLEGNSSLYTRDNTVGQILENGVLLFRANFDGDNPTTVNNNEAIDLTGTLGPNNGAALAPAQTNFLVASPTLPFGSGVKLFENPGGADPLMDDAGIDSGDDDGGSARLSVPRGERDGNFFDFVGNSWDGAFDGNSNGGLATAGHTIFRGSLGGAASDISDPAHAWPLVLDGVEWGPVLPSGTSRANYRNGDAVIFELDCSNRLHIAAGYSRTGSSGAGATGEQEVMFVDAVTAASAAGNGYSDGAYYFAASPNFQTGFFAGRYTAPMSGAGVPGNDADFRFVTTTGNASGGEGRMSPAFDVNRDGDMVVVWRNTAENAGFLAGDPFADANVYEVRLYEAVVGGDCIADEYNAPLVIARNGATITERGITYADGALFDAPVAQFCDDEAVMGMNLRGLNVSSPFSAPSIDNQGNVAFTGTTQVFYDDFVEPADPGFEGLSCWDVTPGFENDTVQFIDSSSTSLFFYVRSEDALLEMVKSSVGGLEMQADVAGSPEPDLSIVLGRFPTEDDSERFQGASLADRGFTLATSEDDNVTSGVAALAFYSGSFFRDANDDMDFDDPSGFFAGETMIENDGGLLLDRSNPSWNTDGSTASQILTAVQGVAVVEFGDIVIEDTTPVNDCVADFDNDGDVDLDDFAEFGGEFGRGLPGGGPACTVMNPCVADFDNDGDVDLDDFAEFGGEFGRGLPGGGPSCLPAP